VTRPMMSKKHQCTAYHTHYSKRNILGITMPFSGMTIVRCEQRASHCLAEDGSRDLDAFHDAAHPEPGGERLRWTERVLKWD
jgi:hypothetical protein